MEEGGLISFPDHRMAKGFSSPNPFSLPPNQVKAIQVITQQMIAATPSQSGAILTDGANIATDASAATDFFVTIEGNRTMDIPTNPTNLRTIRYWITQDATGSRTITWPAGFRFSTGLPSPTLTTTPSFMDLVEFQYNESYGTWDCIRIVKGFDATSPP